jgi:hypothetical protein
MREDSKEPGASKDELIAEIERRISYLIHTDEFTPEEKDEIVRSFLRALHEE